MQDAGLTVGGFYAHFTSKTALMDAAIRRTAMEMREKLFARIDEKPEADRAEVVLKRYLSAAHRDTGKLGCPFPAVVSDIGTNAPEHSKALAEQVEAFANELSTHIQATRAGLSPKYLALGLVALMHGGLSLARALKDRELSEDMLRACRLLGASALSQARRLDGGTASVEAP
jgi:TetR/AcrR family transcriptional repressor of nem operon